MFNKRNKMILNISLQQQQIGADVLFLHKQKVKRAGLGCSNSAENNPKLQQANSSMIIGNNDRSYFTQHRHRPRINNKKSALCEEDNGLKEIMPDSPIKDRALCGFVHVKNINHTRLSKTIPEVQCTCTKSTNKNMITRGLNTRHENVYYHVPVIKFKGSCGNYEKTTERVSLVYVSVLGSQSVSKLPTVFSNKEESVLFSK